MIPAIPSVRLIPTEDIPADPDFRGVRIIRYQTDPDAQEKLGQRQYQFLSFCMTPTTHPSAQLSLAKVWWALAVSNGALVPLQIPRSNNSSIWFCMTLRLPRPITMR